ncbi:putative GAL4-like Zn(II)2Cys6 (or C6 zinc) binuclear cluster DNA-binding domain [Lyophyllum shimeji]|uniref:GAL4-like Zn(II)2Cys6 (Or C6 zinc) binuclear cluster DNA-binding domain n=1 Tax=Lyophyllum shimeji TaxID=47721 RepID=A0A9P3PVU5_LYOSH|nr:putative GAL4-like Zn(II)2Cys6 (or C6 zinc) binuclear cluster DNA-binding domain [Lyophyllum shimeji]
MRQARLVQPVASLCRPHRAAASSSPASDAVGDDCLLITTTVPASSSILSSPFRTCRPQLSTAISHLHHHHMAPATAPASAPAAALPSGQYPYLPFPPADGSPAPAGENGQTAGAPPGFMMFQPPPGMVYYPAQTPVYTNQPQNGQPRPKRKQVKMACTNCATACKRCDERRPCERCVKYNMAETCVDGQRKERKKGIKRGPYKRKNKNPDDTAAAAAAPPFHTELTPAEASVGGWRTSAPPGGTPGAPTPPAGQAQAPPMQPVSQFVPGEGFYPMFYPPPPGFLPPPPPEEGGGAPPHPAPPPIHWMAAGPYPPFPYPGFLPGPPQPHAAYPYPVPYPYPPPPPPGHQSQSQPQGTPAPSPQQQQPQPNQQQQQAQAPPPPVIAGAADPVGAVNKSTNEAANADASANAPAAAAAMSENGATNGKKRGRAPKTSIGAEGKPRKVKRAKGTKIETGTDPSDGAGAEVQVDAVPPPVMAAAEAQSE